MKTMSDKVVVELAELYEKAEKQEHRWKVDREDAVKRMRQYVTRKYLPSLTRKARELCRKNVVSNDRHWWLKGTRVHPSVDHSVSPWTVSALATVSVGLYIHEAGEVARDELEISFNVLETDVALARLGRMMAAGVGERGKR